MRLALAVATAALHLILVNPMHVGALPATCLPTPLPTTPIPPTFNLELSPSSASDHASLVLWRQQCQDESGETAVLVRITPVSTGPFICSSDLFIVQNGQQISARIAPAPGQSFCNDLFVPATFLLVESPSSPTPFSEPAAFTLIYNFISVTSSVDIPPGAGAPPPPSPPAHLVNLSTRARVETGDDVMIAGFVVSSGAPKRVLVRAIGPSLANFGVTGFLVNPLLQVFSGQTAIAQNDDWSVPVTLCQQHGFQCGSAADIAATGLAPTSPVESAILVTLPPGPYTAIVSGGTGVALVEVYELP